MLLESDEYTPTNLIHAFINAFSTNEFDFNDVEINFMMNDMIIFRSEPGVWIISLLRESNSLIRTMHFLLKCVYIRVGKVFLH